AMSISVATRPPCSAPRLLTSSGPVSSSGIRRSSVSSTSRKLIWLKRWPSVTCMPDGSTVLRLREDHSPVSLGVMPVRTALRPGVLSSTLPVPRSIVPPEYAWKTTVNEGSEPWVQTPEVIEKMRVAGRIAAGALAAAGNAVAPGVPTDELDRIAHEYMIDHGAYPSTLGYKGFPKSCCTSLNEIICHGIPDDTVIEDGDIVNIDVTAYIDGVHGDTNATFLAGDVSEEHRLLVERTHEATMRAIKAVKPGRQLSVVGRVIESYANRFGYNVVRDFTGHGIGTTFHNGLVVLHYDQPAVDTVLEPGMTFTIEPMINLGALDYEIWDDGWTVATKDKKWTAQFEHTLVVTDDGAEILTQLCDFPREQTQKRTNPIEIARFCVCSAEKNEWRAAGGRHHVGRREVDGRRGAVPAVGPQGHSRRAVQGAEHVQQLGGHDRRRRDRQGAGHASPRRGTGAQRPVQPDPAQAGQRPHLPTGAARPGRRHRERRRLLHPPGLARRRSGRRIAGTAKRIRRGDL